MTDITQPTTDSEAEPTTTRKVVLSASHNGYWLSLAARFALRGLGHTDPERLPRDHPDLVAVVERLGDAAGGPMEGDPLGLWGTARLGVAVIPAESDWLIEDYDGAEWVVIGTRWTEEGQVPAGRRQPWRRSDHDEASARQIATPMDKGAP